MKKILACILCLLLIFSVVLPVSAVEEKKYNRVMDVLKVNATRPKDIVIDGKIEGDEWGKPIYTTTPKEMLKLSDYGWLYQDVNGIPENQRVELYVTNDLTHIYVACKLIGADYDAGGKDGNEIKERAHFGFTLAYYDATNVVRALPFKGPDYEHYAHYVFGTVEGEIWSRCCSQGMSIKELDKEDYSLSYNKSTRTYTYEVRVPMSYTEFRYDLNMDIVMSFDIGDARGEKGANRYMLSRAAEKAWPSMGGDHFVHRKTNPLVIQPLRTADMDLVEIEPTDEAEAWAQDMDQSGFIEYDKVTRTEEEAISTLRTIDIIAMVAAGVLVIFTVIFLIVRKKRS
jgi:hypothetical protein